MTNEINKCWYVSVLTQTDSFVVFFETEELAELFITECFRCGFVKNGRDYINTNNVRKMSIGS